jgi:Fe2+ transport system protein FeoA
MINRLVYCKEGNSVKITDVAGGRGAHENIHEIGLDIGDKIQIAEKVNCKGPVELLKDDRKIKIGNELASKILVDSDEEITLSLDKIRIGDEVKVVKMDAKGEIRQRLIDMGLIRGALIKLIRKAPLGDPIEVMLNGFYLSLRLEEAKHILVKVIEIGKTGRNGRNS